MSIVKFYLNLLHKNFSCSISNITNCNLPKTWAINLHYRLRKLLDCNLNYVDIQALLIKFETCNKCTNENLCENIYLCKDQIRFIRYLSNHFFKLRTLMKRLYEIRRIIIWIMQIEESIQSLNIETINNLLENNLNMVKLIFF